MEEKICDRGSDSAGRREGVEETSFQVGSDSATKV